MELKDSQGIFNKPVNVSVTARLAEIFSLHCIKMKKSCFSLKHLLKHMKLLYSESFHICVCSLPPTTPCFLPFVWRLLFSSWQNVLEIYEQLGWFC